MRKFELIKEYPGSPKLGSVREPNGFGVIAPMFSLCDVEKFTDHWKEIDFNEFGIISYWADEQFTIVVKSHIDPENFQNQIGKLTIGSIIRIHDKQKFCVGDYVQSNDSWGLDCKIEKIYIKNNQLYFYISDSACSGTYNQPLSEWKVVEPPLFNEGDFFTTGDTTYYVEKITQGSVFVNWKTNKYRLAQYTIYEVNNYFKNGDWKIVTPIFTTNDGVKMFEGDNFWIVNTLKNKLYSWGNENSKSYKFKASKNPPSSCSGEKFFSTKEKAEEYILFNKKCLSLQEVFEVYPQFKKKETDTLTAHAKTLIGKIK